MEEENQKIPPGWKVVTTEKSQQVKPQETVPSTIKRNQAQEENIPEGMKIVEDIAQENLPSGRITREEETVLTEEICMIRSTEDTAQEEIKIPEGWKTEIENPVIKEGDKVTTGKDMRDMKEEASHHI